MIKKLIKIINSHGDMGAIVPFSRIDDLKKDMIDLKNGEYHTSWLDRMANHMTGDTHKFIPSDANFEPISLISIIIPGSKALLQFNYRNNTPPKIVSSALRVDLVWP